MSELGFRRRRRAGSRLRRAARRAPRRGQVLLQTRFHRGRVHCTARRNGRIIAQETVPMAPIALDMYGGVGAADSDDMLDLYDGLGVDTDELGFGRRFRRRVKKRFKKIKRRVKKAVRKVKRVAKKVAKSKIVRGIAKVVKHPAFAAALSVVPGAQGAAAGLMALKMAKKVAKFARKGSKKAKALIAVVRTKKRALKLPTAKNLARFQLAKKIAKKVGAPSTKQLLAAARRKTRSASKLPALTASARSSQTFLVTAPSGRKYTVPVLAGA